MTAKPVPSNAEQLDVCHICGQAFSKSKLRPWISVRPGVSDLISSSAPGWAEGKQICKRDLVRFRRQYVEQLLEDERGELNELDRQVIESIESGQLVSRNPLDEIEKRSTFGERTADKVAKFGGSWTFILSFAVVLIAWITLNVVGLSAKPFDPYPFILLNLVLSCLAAMQAPVIMMSQGRQGTKDRLRAENDYRVNLKAELEIRQLHEKIDHQLAHQWQKLVELQQIQIELLEDSSDGIR
ncbi:DUF1003 domain-containing protein [Marinobacter sp.]|uniref:DUF1003 domain-containing protein n=1 Tax=Marinobacter sp. TaxID=50741 RepID=UPI001B3CD608|nr:DUF1003 domain-containing protein [Marinobacter sp.]MBQ0832672.1 DUF1003 domain-containing protein [Marinobacter sp.]